MRLVEMCTAPPKRSRHTCPHIVHPNSSFWAHGAPFGPFMEDLTFKSSGASRTINKHISASGSKAGISLAIPRRWMNFSTISGVGISRLSSGMLSHSIQVGNLTSFPPKDFAVSPETRCLYITPFEPLQVDKKYLFFFPFILNLSANTGVIIDALLCSSINAYTGCFRIFFEGRCSLKRSCCRIVLRYLRCILLCRLIEICYLAWYKISQRFLSFPVVTN